MANTCALLGSGMARTSDGVPLRPGGLALTEELLDMADFRPGSLVIDIGCGQGSGVSALYRRGLHAVGMDAAAAPIALAVRRCAEAAFVVASGHALPLCSASVDGVLAECSLSVMGRHRHILAEWRRVLRVGGRVAISDIYARWQKSDPETSAADLSALADWSSIACDVIDAGFRILRFDDRSDVLRLWAARYIFEYGSLDALWSDGCGFGTEAVRRLLVGYYVMIAEKTDDVREETGK
jgi:SAM-dependent methyltransferase